MSNLPVLPESAPSFLATLLADNPYLAAANEAALQGMSSGMHPLISINGTRFFVKEGGNSEVLSGKDGNPLGVLGCVIITAKGPIEKKCYLTAYDPNTATAPDCQSYDGITPDPNSPHVQNPTCAGCWANVFGSGKKPDGSPSDGKACADLKKLAIFANGKAYGFYIPPGSLKNFTAYVRDLSARQIPLWAVITSIGFDLQTPQILTFTYMGMLDPQKQIPMVVELSKSQEVKDIIEWRMPAASSAPQPQIASMPQTPTQEAKTEIAPPKREKKSVATKTETKMETVQTQAPESEQAGFDLGLGEAAGVADPSDDDITKALFG